MTTNFPKPLDKQVAAISDSLSKTQDGLAIVANGNTHAAISSGQFVYVKNHDTLAEGLYKATSAIDANGALSTSNLTADGGGGLNDLQGQITSLNSKIKQKDHQFTKVTNSNTNTHYVLLSSNINSDYNIPESAKIISFICTRDSGIKNCFSFELGANRELYLLFPYGHTFSNATFDVRIIYWD